jgi:hypothetical protein
MAGDALTIGDLGAATDTKVESIRYYERIGLKCTAARMSAIRGKADLLCSRLV